METREALDRALSWHSTGPIRVTESGSSAHGAVLHGLDRRMGGPLDVYTEITGYDISLCDFLARAGGETRLLTAARNAADFLVRIQTDEPAYPQLPDRTDPAQPSRLYSFDNAACIVGMTRLAKSVRESRYLESASAVGDWLLGMQRPDGSFSAMAFQYGSIQDPGGFFGDGSCIHAKNAMAFLELYAMTGREHFRDAASRTCEYTLTLQAPDGAFWSRPDRRHVFTHAHCYACEGLLYSGSFLGEARYTAAARRGIEWLAGTQQEDGGWLANYKASVWSLRRSIETIKRPRPSDVAAQAVRLFSLMGQGYDSSRRAAIRFLIGCQEPGGGFSYCKTRFGYSPLLYTWCAQFALQALAWDSRPATVEDIF